MFFYCSLGLQSFFFSAGLAEAEEWQNEPLIDVQEEYQDVFFHFWVWQLEPLDATVIAVLDYELHPGQVGTYAYRIEIEEFETDRYETKIEKHLSHPDKSSRIADAEIIIKGLRPVIDSMYGEFMLYPPQDEEMRTVRQIVNVLYNAGIVIHYKIL